MDINTVYLTGQASEPYTVSNIENALEGTAEIVETHQVRPGTTVTILAIADWRAEWASNRLFTCLYGGHVFNSLDEARQSVAILIGKNAPPSPVLDIFEAMTAAQYGW